MLPRGSDALGMVYKEAIQRIQGQEPGFVQLAWRVLSWITCAKRPLTGKELQLALAVEPSDSEPGEDNLQDLDELVELCAGLVTVDKEGSIIRLVHYTAQEYFEKMQTSLFPDAQHDIAVTCITYLSFPTFESGLCITDDEFEARMQLYPLYDYGAKHWGDHARASSTKVNELALNLLQREQKALAATQALMASTSFPTYRQRVPKHMIGLHLAVYFELEEVISILLNKGYYLDYKDSSGQTPLSWAAENGHKAVVKLLLENGAEIDAKDNLGQTPLLWAARNGYEKVVRLLLEEGAELGPMLLLWAARKGHEPVVKLLIERGAELESPDSNQQTPLSWAARNGHDAVVRVLIEKGAGLNSNDKCRRMPLSWAAEHGQESVVRLLIENGAKIDSRDADGRTPLIWAAKQGRKVIAKMLLEAGAKLESKDNNGQTAFSWAVE